MKISANTLPERKDNQTRRDFGAADDRRIVPARGTPVFTSAMISMGLFCHKPANVKLRKLGTVALHTPLIFIVEPVSCCLDRANLSSRDSPRGEVTLQRHCCGTDRRREFGGTLATSVDYERSASRTNCIRTALSEPVGFVDPKDSDG